MKMSVEHWGSDTDTGKLKVKSTMSPADGGTEKVYGVALLFL